MVEHLNGGRRAGKPEAVPLDHLLQIRAYVPDRDWTGVDLSVELTFLVNSPLLFADLNAAEPSLITEARAWAESRTCCEIAQRLSDEAELLAHLPLWEALVSKWASLAQPQGRIASIEAIVYDVYTYTAAQMIESDQVELDHLTRETKAS